MQVILVGPLDSEAIGTDGKPHFAEGEGFHESRGCWTQMGYLTVHEYHVEDVADIEFQKTMRTKSVHIGHNDRDWEAVRVRDAHVHVRAAKLVPLLKEALQEVAALRAVEQQQ